MKIKKGLKELAFEEKLSIEYDKEAGILILLVKYY